MKNIFKIELKRLLMSKLSIAVATVVGIYSYYVMQQDIILGVDGTAPYSGLSCATYAKCVLPVLVAGMLLLIAKPFGKQERKVLALFDATGVERKKYFCVRSSVIIIVCSLLCMIPVICAVVTYCRVFA